MSCPRKAPQANIDWKRIPYNAKVDLCGKKGAQSALDVWATRGRR